MEKSSDKEEHGSCIEKMLAVRDTLDAISGKWKIMIMISLNHGHTRFREIERSIPKITSKVLAKELKDLEEYELIKRTVHNSYPVLVEYTPTPYARSLDNVLLELYNWGVSHRKKIMSP